MEPATNSSAERRKSRGARSATRAITAARPAGVVRFRDEEALAAGLVTLISLDAVVEHLAADWQGRRVEVYDRASRVLSKRLAGAGDFVRISETDYLLIQTDCEQDASEAAAVKILREIAEHFMGETTPAQLRLSRVSSLTDSLVTCQRLDAADILDRADRRVVREDGHAGWDILAGERWAPFVTGDGRKVRPSCILEPVFDIASQQRIGYRLRRRLLDVETGEELTVLQQRNLARADILRIDTATLARGIDRLSSAVNPAAELSLIMPVSYYSLTHPDGGQKLSQMFARARTSVRAGIICEIYDIEGVAQPALSAVVAMVRPWSLFVVGCLTDDKPRASAAMKTAGIQVLSFTVPTSIESDAEFIGWARAGIRSARRVGRSVMVYGCRTQRRLAVAGLLGATHASLTG